MRLRRLELQGFKSFLDRTILTFQPGITGVVGPNGCGKSNIVDAIQWVMGEQSAKHLRGESMSDVIFNGSDTKQASSMAEVSLILEREGVSLSPMFSAFDKSDEISITRRVYRDGTSEYLINKVACRLKDIHELFMDTGVGKRAYSIIEQGQIDRMINVKPEERRYLFEEVAGITKYKAKRKEAEKKLEATRQNMLRLQDIINELEKQIRSLKVQATRAKKYKELKSELEVVDLYLLGRNLFIHKKAIDDCTFAKNQLVTERSESDAAVGQVDAEATELEITRIEQEKAYTELSDSERKLSLLLQRLEGEMSLLEERKKHLEEGYENSKREASELSHLVTSLSEEVEREAEEKDTVMGLKSSLETEVNDLDFKMRESVEAKSRADHRRRELENKKNHYAHKNVALEHQKVSVEERERNLIEEREKIEDRSKESAVQIEELQTKLVEAEALIQSFVEKAKNAESEVALVSTECEDISSSLSALEDQIYSTRESFHSQKSRLDSLKELQENMEGYSPTAREMLLKLGEQSVSAIPFAEILQPEASLEDHLELLLGSDMNTLIVNTTEEAQNLARTVTKEDLERVKIIVKSEIATQPGTAQSLPSDAIPLLSKIRVAPELINIAEWRLKDTYLVPTTERLFELRKEFPNLTFITNESKTIGHGDRSLTSGKLPTKMGVFARKREIEELLEATVRIEGELARLSAEREEKLANLKAQEDRHEALKDTLSSIHIETVGHRKEKEQVVFELGRAQREHADLQHKWQMMDGQINETKARLESIILEHQEILQNAAEVEEELTLKLAEITTLSASVDEMMALVNEKKIERSRVEERLVSLEYKVKRLRNEIEQHESNLEDLRRDEESARVEIDGMAAKRQEVELNQATSLVDRDATLVKLSDTKAAFNDTCGRLNELREKRTELHRRREEVLGQIQELEIKITHEQSSFDQLCSISNERYLKEPTPFDESIEIEIEKLPIFVEQLSVEWAPMPQMEKKALLEEHLKTVREKISRYGEVNLTAIQEFDEIQKRFDFLMEQKTDLEKSIGILEEAIQKIEETTKVRFEETFNVVNSKFTEIFPILFSGGKSELALVPGENGQDAGVDILVQPPGKSLKSITLLSGGEKALTAVSLILAIFARKPSPFCLLDEVDAPLDDANVSRFNTVIKKMAEKTQFIVITHNKKTMEIAEALYGVTMERPGISKMTSVRMQ